MKYQLGDKFVMAFEVTDTDIGDNMPYYISTKTSPTETGNGFWVSEVDLEASILEANPEVKKAKIKQKIESLQKELEQMECINSWYQYQPLNKPEAEAQ